MPAKRSILDAVGKTKPILRKNPIPRQAYAPLLPKEFDKAAKMLPFRGMVLAGVIPGLVPQIGVPLAILAQAKRYLSTTDDPGPLRRAVPPGPIRKVIGR